MLTIRIELTKFGNQLPYFSITGEINEGYKTVAFGCLHEEILAAHPEYADIVALHLSDINGVPMHAVENGWYWLTSSMGGMGEKYFHPNKIEAVNFFCKHCRITIGDATIIAAHVQDIYDYSETPATDAKARWTEICEAMKPRWKREADAAIKKYNLKVMNRE